jgi:hypothetical protein
MPNVWTFVWEGVCLMSQKDLGVLELLYRIVVIIKSILWHKVC